MSMPPLWISLSVLRANLEQALGPEAFAAAWSRGVQLDIPAAVALLGQHLAYDHGEVSDEPQ